MCYFSEVLVSGKKENIFIMFLLLRIENGLLRKQNVITSQVEYYYFVDGVHHLREVRHSRHGLRPLAAARSI